MIGEEGKRHYVLIKYFNTLMYDQTLHDRRKYFCRWCLQFFSTAEIVRIHVVDCFKINDEQIIKMLTKGEYDRLKNYRRKIKSPFII